MRVLISALYAMPVLDRYRRELEAGGCDVIVADVRERLTEEDLLAMVQDVDGVICGDDRFTPRVFEAARRLKVIAKWGTGIDSIDLDAARRHGVIVCNTPNAFSEPVADTVMGYVLLFARQTNRMDREVKSGLWTKPQLFALREKTLGVIGVGNCGKAVVRRAVAFGMRVLGNDLLPIPSDFIAETGLEVASKDTLLREADFVTLHTTLNPTSYHLIDDRALEQMRSTAYLVNTSRGSVVDEAALVRALTGGRIAGAALDVFEEEPLPADSPLRAFPNCLLAPHNANSSPLAAERVHVNTIKQLLTELHARR